ncbi:hybrid sensor histidine kinase/response regulator [Halobaculum limi]|uniref:hybrid sensor histidine kinase/response regulator n=1 Tax=Halobaculum limi TaxID=3031916 RepID=UPI002406AAD1|nr:hybrid sensor histidine kinase/response regulator [Halobaculum sp. YSMS11]
MIGRSSNRLLVVEDNADFATLTKIHLEKHGEFEVDVTTDAGEAVEQLEANDYDCVISDYDMPQRNGLELLKDVRETNPNLPFILFTGRGSEEVASQAISADVTDYIQKGGGSNTFELLTNRVQNAVQGFQAERELRLEKQLSERIVQSLPIGLVVHDQDGDVLLRNDRANEILSTTEIELRADTYESSSWELYEEDGELVSYERLPFTRAAAGEELRDVSYTVHTDDGRVKPIIVSGTRLCNDDGDTEAVIIPFETVTED